MPTRNETLLYRCQFLNDDYLTQLFDAFNKAFSDYVIPFALTETQFRNHINLNAVDLERTTGCFEGDRLIGFSLNGFGEWDGRSTVYDAGTGVLPGFRRQGISEALFEMMSAQFARERIEQWLLEVITTNTPATRLYEKLGFRIVREVALLQCNGKLTASAEKSDDFEIRDIETPDWGYLTTFWEGTPSWQNSIAAIERSRKNKRILGAFLDGKCVGYIVFSSNFGRVAQLAVDREFRDRGIATALMLAMQAETAEGFAMQVINIDTSLKGPLEFFKKLGFHELLTQFEMRKDI